MWYTFYSHFFSCFEPSANGLNGYSGIMYTQGAYECHFHRNLVHNQIIELEFFRLVHNTTLNNALGCVVFTSTLVEMQHDARMDSDPILAFSCIAFLRLVVKNPWLFLVINLCISQINTTQGLASLCEPAFRARTCTPTHYTWCIALHMFCCEHATIQMGAFDTCGWLKCSICHTRDPDISNVCAVVTMQGLASFLTVWCDS